MRFSPKTDEEIKMENLIPEGYYRFKVVKADDAKTNENKDKISLRLSVMYNNRERIVFDTLTENFIKKLKSFCDETNLPDKYQDGNLLAKDCLDKSGWCHLGVRPANNGYDPANKVNIYGKPDTKGSTTQPIKQEDDGFSDDLPF